MRYASGSERSRSGEGERAQSRGVVVAGGEFVYRLGKRRGQSVCDATLGAIHPLVAVRDARAIGLVPSGRKFGRVSFSFPSISLSLFLCLSFRSNE